MADLLDPADWAPNVALQIAVEPRPVDLVEAHAHLEALRLCAVRGGLTADEASCTVTVLVDLPAARTPRLTFLRCHQHPRAHRGLLLVPAERGIDRGVSLTVQQHPCHGRRLHSGPPRDRLIGENVPAAARWAGYRRPTVRSAASLPL